MGENIYKLNDLQGINLQNIKTAHEALYQKETNNNNQSKDEQKT